jgi:hypothetical protein
MDWLMDSYDRLSQTNLYPLAHTDANSSITSWAFHLVFNDFVGVNNGSTTSNI